MDYRSLVHDKDVAIFSELRVIVLDIRGFYVSQPVRFSVILKSPLRYRLAFFFFVPQAEFYDIIIKNLDKVTNPKGEEKPSMY